MNEKQLRAMSVEDLIALRSQIDTVLKSMVSGQRRELQGKLAALDRYTTDSGSKRGVSKGTKVAPKYRGPNGELWAGRGARPKWLTAIIKKGRKAEEFLIEKAARKGKA